MRKPITRRNVYGEAKGPDITNFKTLHELADALGEGYSENPWSGPSRDREKNIYHQGKVDLARLIIQRIEQITANPLTQHDLEEEDFVSETG